MDFMVEKFVSCFFYAMLRGEKREEDNCSGQSFMTVPRAPKSQCK